MNSLGLAFATLLFAAVEPARSQPCDPAAKPAPADAWSDYSYQPAKSCTPCHVQPSGNYNTDLVLLLEYPIWKSHDKHAQAYAVLEGSRGQKIAKALDMKVTDPKAGCLNCHGTQLGDKGGDVDLTDGVSCGGCHGPSNKWRGLHDGSSTITETFKDRKIVRQQWKDLSPEDKHLLGYRDLRDPKVRSQLCLSCHVGNASEGKVVTHAMFVAGHPPLPPIELATFARNEPQHWRNSRDVPYFKNPNDEKKKNYHLQDVDYQQTKLALVGSVVAFRETIRLAGDRARSSSDSAGTVWPELLQGMDAKLPAGDALAPELKRRWPELALAHSDCYACHHDLEVPGFRQARGFGYQLSRSKLPVKPAVPGRTLVRIWPTAMLEVAILHAGKPQRIDELQAKLNALTDACNARPFGKPEDLVKVCDDLVKWCDTLACEVEAVPCTEESVKALLKNMASLYVGSKEHPPKVTPDFESARQLASVAKVAVQELKINDKASDFEAELKVLNDQLDIDPFQYRPDRIKVTLDIMSVPGNAVRDNDRKDFVGFLEMLQKLGYSREGIPAFNTALGQLRNKNEFVESVNRFNNARFNEAFTDKADLLQHYGDEEQRLVFKAINEYKPADFRRNLLDLVNKATK